MRHRTHPSTDEHDAAAEANRQQAAEAIDAHDEQEAATHGVSKSVATRERPPAAVPTTLPGYSRGPRTDR